MPKFFNFSWEKYIDIRFTASLVISSITATDPYVCTSVDKKAVEK